MVIWRIVVDDQNQLAHIQTTRCNAGSYKDVAHRALEISNRALTVALLRAAVQAQAWVARLQGADAGWCVGKV